MPLDPDADAAQGRDLAHATSRIRLLDADPDLGSDLDGEALAEAREQVLLPAVRLRAGGWDLDALRAADGVHGNVYGFFAIEGALTIDVNLAGRVCTRLVIPNDLVLLDGREGDTLPMTWGWTALEPSLVGVLDGRLLAIGARWPGLTAAVITRAAEQLRNALVQQAIAQIPRVDERLLALMWSIADRAGIVREDGIFLQLPLTHDTLGRMIGARRPTVSLGLKSLSDSGMLVAAGDGWLLNRASLGKLSTPGAAGAESPLSAPASDQGDEVRRS